MKVTDENSVAGSESISQSYGSADPHLDLGPHQNFMEPQHCFIVLKKIYKIPLIKNLAITWNDCLVLLQVAGGGGLVGAAVAGEAEPHVDGVVVVLEVGGGVGDMVALAAGVLHPAVDGDVVATEGAHGSGPVLALVTRILHLVNETNHSKLRNKLTVFPYSICGVIPYPF